MAGGGTTVRVKRLHPAAVEPRAATSGAAGLDLAAALDTPILIPPGGWAAVPTGWAIALPGDHEGQVRPRSGLARRHGVTVLNSPGTIDEDYRGELVVLLINHGAEAFCVEAGDRIAQLVVAPVARTVLQVVSRLDSTERGGGGFGSTGLRSDADDPRRIDIDVDDTRSADTGETRREDAH